APCRVLHAARARARGRTVVCNPLIREHRCRRMDKHVRTSYDGRRREIGMYHDTNGTTVVPPLENGDRLSRAEFERRYDAMPDLKKAELIEGVVYMPSPVRLNQHGKPHQDLGTYLRIYGHFTPGKD